MKPVHTLLFLLGISFFSACNSENHQSFAEAVADQAYEAEIEQKDESYKEAPNYKACKQNIRLWLSKEFDYWKGMKPNCNCQIGMDEVELGTSGFMVYLGSDSVPTRLRGPRVNYMDIDGMVKHSEEQDWLTIYSNDSTDEIVKMHWIFAKNKDRSLVRFAEKWGRPDAIYDTYTKYGTLSATEHVYLEQGFGIDIYEEEVLSYFAFAPCSQAEYERSFVSAPFKLVFPLNPPSERSE